MWTRIWHRMGQWLSKPVYLQMVPWTWSVAEPAPKSPGTNPHFETMTLNRAGLRVWGFHSRATSPTGSRGDRWMTWSSEPETWRQARQVANEEEGSES